jgi:hypothetical protein
LNDLKVKWAVEFCGLMQLKATETNLSTAHMIIGAALEYGVGDQCEMDLILSHAQASLMVDESFAVDRYECKNGSDYEVWQRHHRRLKMMQWWTGVLLTSKQMQMKRASIVTMDCADDDGDYAGPLKRLQEMLGAES